MPDIQTGRPRKGWDQLHPATKAKYKRGGRTEAEARHLYESGKPPPPPRKTKTQRKDEIRAELERQAPKETAATEPLTDSDWADRINAADNRLRATKQDTVTAIITLGKELQAAKDVLGHGNFTAMVENKTRLSLRAAEQYMQVAAHPVLSNPNHGSHLPPHVGTLRVLAGWKPKAVEAAIADAKVTPELERAKAIELSDQYGPAKPIPARPAASAPAPMASPPAIQRRGSGAKSPVERISADSAERMTEPEPVKSRRCPTCGGRGYVPQEGA